MAKIKVLPEDIRNQIAAGEVVERPASVIKELLDNAVDAKASQITIKIRNGGIQLIEVSDNGEGIEKESLPLVFAQHATSKISSINDLVEIHTMGFRGEALASIGAVSKTTVTSKFINGDLAYKIENIGGEISNIQPASHPQGTTIKVEDLFYNIPARKSFLKTPTTEFRKIQENLIRYMLINPHISFKVFHNDKLIYNIPAIPQINQVTLHPQRLKQVLKADFVKEPISVLFEGENLHIAGFTAHPKYNTTRTPHQYIYVNNRPISDNGIIRSVLQGYARFIPYGQKIPFVLYIKIDPKLVDVNVHPRKEEVRFINPYRVYSAIETAIKSALQEQVHEDLSPTTQISQEDIAYTRLRQSTQPKFGESRSDNYTPSSKTSLNINSKFKSQQPNSIQASLEFSQTLLENTESTQTDELPKLKEYDINQTFQIFNKYIVVEFSNQEVWVIDQHAAAERISFERLLDSYKSKTPETQKVLVPYVIKLTAIEYSTLKENKATFEQLGFDLEFQENNKILVTKVPAEFAEADIDRLFQGLQEEKSLITSDFNKKIEDLLATMACHTSIRAGQSLPPEQQRALFINLMRCKNPYSCPHGRPAIWKLTLAEIDKHFYRTY